MTLNELGTLKRGKSRHRPRNDATLYGGKYPFIQTGDIKAAELHVLSHLQTYNEKGLQQSHLWKKGTLCITIAANIAETAVLSYDACFPDSVVGFEPHPEISDVYYVKYLVDFMKTSMQQISRGTTQDNLSLDKLLSFQIEVPDMSTQKQQTSPLLLCDLLIENNNRRIAILEEMAQRLYREWFVHFRFPGHEIVNMVESELGMIPQGWRVVPFLEAVKANPKYTNPKTNSYPYVEMAGLDNSNLLVLMSGRRADFNGSKFMNNDTLVARITPCLENGKTGFVQCLDENEIGVGSTEFIVLKAESILPEMVYLIARQNNFRELLIKSMSGASGRQRANISALSEYCIPVPSSSILETFSKVVCPMFEQIQKLHKRNLNLRKTRDLLLPRLISGDIDASGIDILVPDAN